MGNRILGKYSYQEGGSIYISINENMKYKTEVNTQIHEMNHMHLDNVTTLGNILKILEIERCCTPTIDVTHSSLIEKYQQIIKRKTADIQEIYANGIELLLLQHLGNDIVKKEAYQLNTEKYKQYCDKLLFVVENSELEYAEKHRIINLLCFYAMAVEDGFVELITGEINECWKLENYFNTNMGNPNSRLDYGIECLKQNDLEKLVFCITNQNIIKVIEGLFDDKILRYSEGIAEIYKVLDIKIRNNDISEEVINYWIENYQRKIEERIRVFDFNFLKRLEITSNVVELTNKNICILNIYNNGNGEEKLRVYTHNNREGEYECYEVDKSALELLIDDINCVCIPSTDYLFLERKPQYFKSINKLFVLFEDYRECDSWIKDTVVKGEFYIGDLYDNKVNNFFTILVFADRLQSGVIYLFPTTKKLAKCIIENNGLSNIVVYTNDRAFFTVVAALGTKLDMLKDIQWIMAFITGSKGDFNPEIDSAAKLGYDFTVNIANSLFDFFEKDDYYSRYVLPTDRTKAKPFYIAMMFKKGHNTGKICSCDERYLILFPSKTLGEEWIIKYSVERSGEEEPFIVGVDKLFWKELRCRLKNIDRKIILCLGILPQKNEDIYREYSLEQLDNIIK